MRWVLFFAAFALATPASADEWQVAQRKQSAIDVAAEDFARALKSLAADSKAPTIEDAAEPTTLLHLDLAAVRVAGTRLMTLDPSRVSIAQLDAIDAATEAVIAKEMACRVTPKCAEPRQTRHICQIVTERRGYEDALRAEKSGTVADLKVIYDLEAAINFAEKRLRDAKESYRRVQGKGFAGKC